MGRLRAGPERDLIQDYMQRFDRTGRPLGLGPLTEHEVEDKKNAGMGAEAELLARAVPGYAVAYPFIELALGLAYLTDVVPVVTNGLTAVVMAIGLIGVVRAVMSGQTIRCACLGTGFNLPMSTVTIIENSIMRGKTRHTFWRTGCDFIPHLSP